MKKHIVIIEDNNEMRETLEIILTDAGYAVTGIVAVDTLEELLGLHADCFIIDELLPVITGHIICMILHNKLETKHVPVILTSVSEELESFASLCEAKAYLQKPFKPTELLAIVQQMVSVKEQVITRASVPLNSLRG